MTRISSAPRGLNAFIDQTVNSRSDLAAAAGSAPAGTFDAHLATLNPNSSGKSKPDDPNPALLKNPNDEIAANQKDPAGSLPAFNLKTATGDTPSGQTDPADTVSALFAALKTEGQNTNQTDTPLSALLSLANKAALPAANQTQPEVSSVPNELLAPPRSRFGMQKPTTPVTTDVKGAADSLKRTGQNSDPSSDIAASAQVTIAAVAAALMPQNTVTAPPPAVRNAPAPPSGGSVSALSPRTERANAPASSVLPSDAVQTEPDAVQLPSESNSLDLFGGSSGSKNTPAEPIKMTLSSVQAETHFAPVQQLSPTQQIVDYVALNAGTLTAADPSSDTAAAAGTQASDVTASATASLAGSPVKTLTLALEPDALGTVTVTMRLVNSNLELKVEAEKPETTSLIEKDKDNLSDKLQSMGYSVDSMVVKTAAAQGSHLDPSNDQNAAGQGQQAANDTSSSGASQNGGRNAQDQSQTQSSAQQRDASLGQESAPASADRSVGDGIYL
jgi:chemotaxis protein MotD